MHFLSSKCWYCDFRVSRLAAAVISLWFECPVNHLPSFQPSSANVLIWEKEVVTLSPMQCLLKYVVHSTIIILMTSINDYNSDFAVSVIGVMKLTPLSELSHSSLFFHRCFLMWNKRRRVSIRGTERCLYHVTAHVYQWDEGTTSISM